MSPATDDSLKGLFDRFPCLAGLAPDRVDWFRRKGAWLDAPQKSILFDVGKRCLIFPLLCEGEIQVLRNTRSGREIELYRVQPGEPCLVSTSCLLGMANYPALGMALSPVRLAVLSHIQFEALLAEHAPFRRFVFGSFSQRMSTLMQKVEQVAFMRLEQRLAQTLSGAPNPWRGTHQELADQLGASREVISRLLKSFERAGWISLNRGAITILSPDSLARLAATAELPGL
jgi:CRP/FNR family transcriptional regulator